MSTANTKTDSKINTERIDFEFLRNKLKLKNLVTKNSFYSKYPHVDKFLKDKGLSLDKFRQHSAKVIASGALTGALLLTPPMLTTSMPSATELVKNITNLDIATANGSNLIQSNFVLMAKLQDFLPAKVGPLTRSQEKNLEKIFFDVTGVNSKATLEGEHLNTTYGYIGAEQHLMRYPGDTINAHDLTPDDEGMAPGRGAWGYFARSRSELTKQDVEREKWYAVVQTLYLPDWNSRIKYLRDWYKYRKVMIVNTANGNAVIADIADSGPAAFTGKQFGGSPAVMNYLGGARYKKGAVVMFFVDDPDNKIPLGPVEYNKMVNADIALSI